MLKIPENSLSTHEEKYGHLLPKMAFPPEEKPLNLEEVSLGGRSMSNCMSRVLGYKPIIAFDLGKQWT